MNAHIISNFKLFKKIQLYFLIIFMMIYLSSPIMFSLQLGYTWPYGFTIGLIFGFIMCITITPVHELSHFVAAKICKYPTKLHIFTHVEFTNDLPKNHLIFILIAPLFVHLVSLFIYVVSFPNHLSWGFIFAILLLSSSLGDCYLAYKSLSFDGKSVMFRNKEPGTFEVIPK